MTTLAWYQSASSHLITSTCVLGPIVCIELLFSLTQAKTHLNLQAPCPALVFGVPGSGSDDGAGDWSWSYQKGQIQKKKKKPRGCTNIFPVSGC